MAHTPMLMPSTTTIGFLKKSMMNTSSLDASSGTVISRPRYSQNVAHISSTKLSGKSLTSGISMT